MKVYILWILGLCNVLRSNWRVRLVECNRMWAKWIALFSPSFTRSINDSVFCFLFSIFVTERKNFIRPNMASQNSIVIPLNSKNESIWAFEKFGIILPRMKTYISTLLLYLFRGYKNLTYVSFTYIPCYVAVQTTWLATDNKRTLLVPLSLRNNRHRKTDLPTMLSVERFKDGFWRRNFFWLTGVFNKLAFVNSR